MAFKLAAHTTFAGDRDHRHHPPECPPEPHMVPLGATATARTTLLIPQEVAGA